jgi:hypothetical protein
VLGDGGAVVVGEARHHQVGGDLERLRHARVGLLLREVHVELETGPADHGDNLGALVEIELSAHHAHHVLRVEVVNPGGHGADGSTPERWVR